MNTVKQIGQAALKKLLRSEGVQGKISFPEQEFNIHTQNDVRYLDMRGSDGYYTGQLYAVWGIKLGFREFQIFENHLISPGIHKVVDANEGMIPSHVVLAYWSTKGEPKGPSEFFDRNIDEYGCYRLTQIQENELRKGYAYRSTTRSLV